LTCQVVAREREQRAHEVAPAAESQAGPETA
jgi:hypothetical protein